MAEEIYRIYLVAFAIFLVWSLLAVKLTVLVVEGDYRKQ
jgi:hypothetical protein